MNFKTLGTSLGVIFLLLGFFSLVLMMVGIKLSFLQWIDAGGRLTGFVLKLSMAVLGGTLIALAQTNWKEERKIPENAE